MRVGARTSEHKRCFFLILENLTGEKPIALLLTLIRWWEWVESSVGGVKIKKANYVERHRGSHWWCGRMAWETLLESYDIMTMRALSL